MRKRRKKYLSILIAAAVLFGGIQLPSVVKAQENVGSRAAAREAVTVSTPEQFMQALNSNKSPITVQGSITIGEDEDTDKRMLPVKIPAGTVIQGTGGGEICFRSPIQLEGDGVRFQNIKLAFISTDSLGSVPHREIFLAGHSLTLDNVNTYKEGGNGAPGSILGSEKELLPTVYAGGYTGTANGSNASLTVINSNDETMFQAIYMGHGAGNDSKASYTGNAIVNLDENAIVRDYIDTSLNSQAKVTLAGPVNKTAKTKKFYGNENTTLTVDTVSAQNTTVDNIGNIILKNGACLSSATKSLCNVTLQNGACLDFVSVGNAHITGNFTGESDVAKRGILVLQREGSLQIDGKIIGTTQFQTGHRLYPGVILPDRIYITAKPGNSEESNFVLAQENIELGCKLNYLDGVWKTDPKIIRRIGHIEILSAPSVVNSGRITSFGDAVSEGDPHFQIKWYDKEGVEFSDTEVEDNLFYEVDQVLCIKTEYWKSDEANVLEKTDWLQGVTLSPLQGYSERYYLQKYDEIAAGDYTFLFLSSPCEYYEDLYTVADVKALKDSVMAEQRVIFNDQDSEESEHIHFYQSTMTKQATCTEEGVKEFICECGDKYTRNIKALGHQEVVDPAVEPTETTAGKTEGSHCSVCGIVIREQEVIPALGHKHSYQSTVTKKATCTEKGVRTYTCSCGDSYTEEIAATGHKAVVDPAVKPTETTAGKTEGSHCSVCGAVIRKQEVIPALGKPAHIHSYQSAVTKKATSAQKGIITYTCGCGNKYTKEIASPNRKFTLKKTDYSYDGKVKTPSVTVKDSIGTSLKKDTDYKIQYPKGRKNPGVYTVTVGLCGNYSGRLTGSFTIRPKKTSLKKVTAKSKGMQVTWNKQKTQIDGYQIQYCTSGKFKGKTLKTATAKKNDTSKKISKLKGKQKYYVRIRTYKTVKVNGKSKKLYSDWSGKKTVNTKK